MKYRVWTLITDGGDGEHHSTQYPSKEKMLEDNPIEIDYEDDNGGSGFDEYDYHCQWSVEIIDMSDYEVVA